MTSPTRLGPDTVRLRFRDPVLDGGGFPVIGADGRPTHVDRVVEKVGVKFTLTGVSETSTVPPVAVYNAKAALPVDADALALKKTDAIEHAGAVYELAGDAKLKKTLLDGIDHHVRVFCTREEPAGSSAEQIVVTPRGGQDDDGRREPDGVPFPVLAIAVDAGNTAAQYGIEGTVDQADFTVVLPLGSGVRNDDWVTVRGRRGLARIQTEYSQHADRNQEVVTVRSRTGGG